MRAVFALYAQADCNAKSLELSDLRIMASELLNTHLPPEESGRDATFANDHHELAAEIATGAMDEMYPKFEKGDPNDTHAEMEVK